MRKDIKIRENDYIRDNKIFSCSLRIFLLFMIKVTNKGDRWMISEEGQSRFVEF